jgi:flagellin-specific chaperone FliS
MAKIGEITLDLDKDIKKDAKESLDSLFSYASKRTTGVTMLGEAKKATKVKVTLETV